MTQRIVINAVHGGFSLSREAFLRLRELKHPVALEEPDIGEMWPDGSGPRKGDFITSFLREIDRDDPLLIQVIEEMGAAAYGQFSRLKIVDVPDDVEWQIEEYDGAEWVAEKHRTWR